MPLSTISASHQTGVARAARECARQLGVIDRDSSECADADATLMVTWGVPDCETRKRAQHMAPPYLLVDVGAPDAAAQIVRWLLPQPQIATLQIVGPCEDECPGIYAQTLRLLTLCLAEHYIDEQGLFVMTPRYLLARGHCCQNGCRHCPYGYRKI